MSAAPVPSPAPAQRLTDEEAYKFADRHGYRYRTPDEEGMQFDKHAVLDFARDIEAEILRRAAVPDGAHWPTPERIYAAMLAAVPDAPAAQPVEPTDDARDAARYRQLRAIILASAIQELCRLDFRRYECDGNIGCIVHRDEASFDSAIDAAMRAAGDKPIIPAHPDPAAPKPDQSRDLPPR